MSDFTAKMHQIRLSLGSAPDPAEEAYSALSDPLSVFKGPDSKGRERVMGGQENGKGREREGEGEGRGFAVPMSNCFLCASVLSKITY